ncbi:MAG: SDR family NAD(P)-dependent oxidoreductase [Acidiphilium sp.]
MSRNRAAASRPIGSPWPTTANSLDRVHFAPPPRPTRPARRATWPFPRRSIFGPVYPASKTALNAMTLAMASELESTGIKDNAACPGFTKTNFNNYAGTQIVEEGARGPVRLALLGPDGPTCTFLRRERPNLLVTASALWVREVLAIFNLLATLGA